MQNEKIKTPNDGATTLVVDSNTKGVSVQENLKELAEEIKRQDTKVVADKYFSPARKSGYICECDNGTGDDGTGAEIYFNSHHNRYELKCQKCGRNLNNLEIIAYGENLNLNDKKDFAEAVKIGCELYGLNFTTKYISEPKKHTENLPTIGVNDAELKLIHDDIEFARGFFAQCNQEITEQGRKLTIRGLTYDTLNFFGCGFIDEWISPKNRIEFEQGKRTKLPPSSQRYIVPTANHYNAVLPEVDRTYENKKFWKMHAGAKEIFGAEFLTANADLILVVEGEFDAMSIWQATQGKKEVIATGGAADKRVVKFLHDKFTDHKPKILILFDSDDTGRLNSPKLRDELLNIGFPAVCKFLSDENSKLDANQILQEQGDEKLNEIISSIVADAQNNFSALKKELEQCIEKAVQFNSQELRKMNWQKHNGEIDPETLKYLQEAKNYLEKLKVDDITTGVILSSQTKYAVANCLFYDFYSDCATNFVTRMKSAIQMAKEKVKSATAENPVADEIKSLSSIRPSDFDKAVSVIVTETKNKHKNFLLKLNAEKAKERREQYEQAPSTTRTNCPDCPVDLVLPYQTSFEKSRGIFANDDKGRPKCISRTPLVPTRQFVNPSEGTHHYEIAINTHGNEWQKVIYDAESLFNAKNVMNLVNDGAKFSSKTAADISEWLATILSIPENQEFIQRVDIYNQPGWTDETCTEFIYPQNEEKYLVRTKNFDYEKAFAKRGEKSEWLKMFKKVLEKSAVTRLTLGAALSAPLVNVLNVRNLQLHLSCPSGNGKSALVKFATSTYGNPEKFKFKFNGTSNSFETQSTLFNDLPSWLEELQSANKKQRENIDQVIYDYESGIGRGRNTKNNFLQKQKYFRGCRISTGEQNLTNQFSGEGAISRILEITRADIFDNDFAIDIHKFCAENFGHFGQDWINFIVANKADIRKYFNDIEKKYHTSGLMNNHVTTIAACHTALTFFCKMIDCYVEDIEDICIFDFKDFVSRGELPSKDRATNASRALQTVAETVASHPKFFKAEKYNSGEDVLTLTNSDEGSAMYDYGFILKNGDVAIYPSALREILKDYPSVDALIRNFAECGYLDCGTNEKRPYQKQAKCNGTPRWIYRFKKSALEN